MNSPSKSPEPPPAAQVIFGERLGLARRFADLLATDGVLRGLIGPREAPRLWERHLLNCAVVGDLIPFGSSVVDVGSGAGLPGIVLAVARPDLAITLVEPMTRRSTFLLEAVDVLELGDAVGVVRGRAEEYSGPLVDVVTVRAVAALDRLAGWCLPLLVPNGRLLALKGESAAAEVESARASIRSSGGLSPQIRYCGGDLVDQPTTVVEVVRASAESVATERAAHAGRRGARRP